MDLLVTTRMLKLYNFAEIEVLHLEPTTYCNAACPQCARYDDQGNYNQQLPVGNLTIDDIKKNLPVSFIQQLKKMFMCGNYGEPTAAQDCLEIFQYFKEVNPNITLGLNTNGGTRLPSWWAKLAETMSGTYDYVVFSIDGLEDTNHVYRKNVRWDKLINNAKAFIQGGGSAHWDMLVFSYNQHQVNNARELARELGFNWFRTKVSNRFAHRNTTIVSLPGAFAESPQTPDNNIICQYMDPKTLYISAHGHVLPCCYVAGALFEPGLDSERADLFKYLPSLDQLHLVQGIETAVKQFSRLSNSWKNNPATVCINNCGQCSASSKNIQQWKSQEQLK